MKKKLLPILSIIPLLGFLPSSTDAAVLSKTLLAQYHDIKVKHNGIQVSTDIEPFIVNGTTYVPLRMMANVFNKNISWDGTTYTIQVTDKEDPQIAALQAQIANKDAQIKSLQQQLDRAREDEDDDDDDVDEDISDLEDDLNDDYGDYEDLEWDISLDGDEDQIDVEIAIDFDDYEDDFNDLDEDDLKDLVESVIEDIWDEFPDADIDGTIIDSSSDDEQYDFEGDASTGDIEFDGEEI